MKFNKSNIGCVRKFELGSWVLIFSLNSMCLCVCAAYCAANKVNVCIKSFSIQFSHRSQELFSACHLLFAFLGQVGLVWKSTTWKRKLNTRHCTNVGDDGDGDDDDYDDHIAHTIVQNIYIMLLCTWISPQIQANKLTQSIKNRYLCSTVFIFHTTSLFFATHRN